MGFVKLSNSLPDWAWYHDNNTLAVYIRLLMGAVWQDTGYQNVILKRGQAAATIPKIAAQSGLTVQQTRTVLNRLKSTGKITVENTSKFSIITLIDYDCDVEINSRSNSPTTDEQQAGNSQSTVNQQAVNGKSTGNITVENTSEFSTATPINYACDIEDNSQINSQSTGGQQVINRQYNKQSIDEQQKVNSPTLLNTEYRIQKAENRNARACENGIEKNTPSPLRNEVAVRKPKPEKKQLAEFVSMTDEEYSSLVAKLGEQGAKRCVEILDNYKGANGKKYDSDYRAILNWVVERYEEETAKQPNKKSSPSSFDVEEIMRQIHTAHSGAPPECSETDELIRQIREGKK